MRTESEILEKINVLARTRDELVKTCITNGQKAALNAVFNDEINTLYWVLER